MMKVMEKQLDKKYVTASILKSITTNAIIVLLIGSFLIIPALNATGENRGIAIGGAVTVVGIFFFLFLVSLGVTALRTYLFYKSFTYQIGPDAFTKKFGVLTRRTVVIPYNRVQNVDIVEPLWFRIFGLAQINIQTAAGANNSFAAEGSLPGVSKAEATFLHEEILRLALLSQQQPPLQYAQPQQVQPQPPQLVNQPQQPQAPQQPPQDTGL